MKIEKINDNQIRCTLSKAELADRQIKLSELAYGSEKARSLFRDMIEQANYEFGFEAEDIPLMIEAIPLAGENIILQITKVEYPEELDTRFSRFSEKDASEQQDGGSEKEPSMPKEGADAILELVQKMRKDLETDDEEESKADEKDNVKESTPQTKAQPIEVADITKMYEFTGLVALERLSHVLGAYYTGENDLYKDESKNRYCLFIRKSAHTPEEFNKVCNIIAEYGVQRKYSAAAEAFCKEHGKAILCKNALQVLNSIQEA